MWYWARRVRVNTSMPRAAAELAAARTPETHKEEEYTDDHGVP